MKTKHVHQFIAGKSCKVAVCACGAFQHINLDPAKVIVGMPAFKVEPRMIETRKRDLVIRIADWTRDRDEPAYDVELYVKGGYVGGECFTTKSSGRTKAEAKAAAVAYAQQQIGKLL